MRNVDPINPYSSITFLTYLLIAVKSVQVVHKYIMINRNNGKFAGGVVVEKVDDSSALFLAGFCDKRVLLFIQLLSSKDVPKTNRS